MTERQTGQGTPAKKVDGLTKALLWAFIAPPVLFFAGCAALLALSSGEPTDAPPQRAEVRAACHDWVRGKLKAPTTAKFSGDQVTGGPDEWTVTGYVDAQNSFGAQIRSAWSCDIRLDGDTWRGAVEISD